MGGGVEYDLRPVARDKPAQTIHIPDVAHNRFFRDMRM
jgi:hypothetical protein